MVQEATGLSSIEAGRLLAVGVLMSETETAERRAAEAVREAAWAAQAAAEAAAQAERAAARDAGRVAAWWAARELERAAAWVELHPDLPLPEAGPGPVVPVVAVLPARPVARPVVVEVPWQAPIMHAVAQGTFSPGVGDALLRGLGTLDQAITAEKLAAALRVLLVEAPGMNTEQAFKRARRLRDDLDAAGILAREKQARDDTTWSFPAPPAQVAPIAPGAPNTERTGGTENTQNTQNTDHAENADSVENAEKTDNVESTAEAPSDTLAGFGTASGAGGEASRRPEARRGAQTIHGTEPAISHPVFGYIVGNPAPVSAETIDRHLCDTGYLGILFDQTGQPLNVGRDQRLFNREQRRALAVRDGGCRWPGCEKPPSWTEAHHIENWVDHGLSNIDQAILLCSLHHMLLHNRHWKIWLRDGLYWLQPPIEINPEQTLIALPSKNPLMLDPAQFGIPTSTAPVIGAEDTRRLRDADHDQLDESNGNDSRQDHPLDDYRN
ncbi:HNH endonuclease signature motif containing protein [Cryobacterium sp. Y62]|uniref:HNH endonuclease signature motif containing protein n=1 Tax=Cryobacterium sp. Y62 TaxID=2048284 RepID=UPI000CE5622F|nr:HNH endonuclease signature motif containing protein [Cryobacterium sp. Y62]